MLLSQILDQKSVSLLTNISSKKRLFQEIASHIAKQCNLRAEEVFNALQEREQLGPTGMGNGVAIPHARLKTVDEIKGMFIKLSKPIDFDAVDRQRVDLIFVIIAPSNSSADHLKALAKVSRLLRDQNICSKLRSAEDTSTSYTILTQDMDIKAA
ncbi:MAG: PTS IIA-like nitrogen regulatory protein PtsN [Pseudomonadota bacterium]|nr:PTS IIA-like nitrogen regulatory protein PtsN [Pseudomonadota bacterium]